MARSKATKERLDGLKAIVTTQNTLIDNLSQRYTTITRLPPTWTTRP